MTAQSGYVWFLPVYISMKINDTSMDERNLTSSMCSDSVIRNALHGHFSLSYSSFGDDNQEIEGNMTVRQWKELYLNTTQQEKIQFSDYAGYIYDSFWVYIKALQALMTGKYEIKFRSYQKTHFCLNF
jgi:hypothetical protein